MAVHFGLHTSTPQPCGVFRSRPCAGTGAFFPRTVAAKVSRTKTCQDSYYPETSGFLRSKLPVLKSRMFCGVPKSADSPPSNSNPDEQNAPSQSKTPFGYTRKDVLLIGVGVTALGIGLKGGLEYAGMDPLKAGNVVQLVLVLGLTIGWISTYIFRVSNKDMTYVQQLRDYENKVMQKRLEGLTEAEIEALMEQVEEEKTRIASERRVE